MNRKILIGIVLAAVALVIMVMWKGGGNGVLGEKASLVVYTNSGTSTSKGLLYLPFLKEIKNAEVAVSIAGEEIVKKIKINSQKNWNSGVAVKVPKEITGEVLVRATVNGEIFNIKAVVTKAEIGKLLDLATVTNKEESMKGFATVAYAQEPVTSTFRPGVPDMTQRPAECAPTAAANSILSLAAEHGKSPSDLPTPLEIIDGLKQDTDWTPENGALPNQFVQGKNEWAIKHGLPIRTTKVGDKNGLSTLQQLLGAMDKGAAAELRITFGDPATGKAVGGHMVTVAGIRTEGGQTFIEINDPITPEGTETYEIAANVIVGYPFEGLAVLSWGFVQVWDEQAPSNLDPMTDAEVQGIRDAVGIKEKIKVFKFRNKYVPIAQVHVFKGPECDKENHYHANTGSVKAIDGTVFTDPGDCGYGKVKDIPVEEIQVN